MEMELVVSMDSSPNKINGPNAGGLPQFPIRTPQAVLVGQFWRPGEQEKKEQ